MDAPDAVLNSQETEEGREERIEGNNLKEKEGRRRRDRGEETT
jgi:hypothetical protein